MDTVGVRELKSQLSRHLRRVRQGARITVTERGRAVAVIVPVEQTDDTSWIAELVAGGRARWAGGKPAAAVSRGRSSKRSSVSEAVLEDRE